MPRAETKERSRTCDPRCQLGVRAVGVFLVFGASVAAFAGITLALPGTPLDSIWKLNRIAYAQLSQLGRAIGALFLLLSFVLAFAAIGWFRRRAWGWLLAALIIASQVLGDFGNLIFRRDYLGGGVGVIIAGALLLYIVRPQMRAVFLTERDACNRNRA